jgi:cation:H+ antiporter
MGVVAFITLIISANYVVAFATNLSVDLALPAVLIGLLILSLGTSLPELVLNAKAALSKHDELAIGDTLGSVITNSTLVLGVTALITPISTDIFFFFSSALFMIVITFIFITFGESDRGISWKEGISLILLYVFFLVIETYVTLIRTP